MSYKYTVLKDNPLSFFLLDEVRSGTAGVYSNLTSLFSTYADLRDNGISYAAVSGLPIKDYSGNAMEGYAIDASYMEVLPIVGAGVRGTEINESIDLALKALGIATSKSPDNPFAFEIWFSPDPSDSEEYLILGDATNNIGLFYKNENVIFKCTEQETIWHKVTKNKVMHIVGIFSKDKISLYINGKLVSEQFITAGFKFTNESLTLKIGPANTGKRFLVDSAAIYNYEIEEAKILSHYLVGYKETKYSQIVYSKNGTLFSLNSVSLRPAVSYRYPGAKSLDAIVSGDAYYNTNYKRIEFNKTLLPETKTFVFEERLYVPNPESIVSSRISYGQDVNNILIEVKVPGEDWAICKNNSVLPYYNKNENLAGPILDIRVTMTTLDSSFDLPYFDKLEIDLYSDKDFYSDNGGGKVYSSYDYSLGYYNYPVRMQNKYNGLSMISGHGFSVDLAIQPRTIEMFFTPRESKNILFSSNAASFSWTNAGAITKSGISAIYVNGINRTTSTNVSDFFLSGVSHHVLIVLSAVATGIKFNQNQSGSEYGGSNTYSNLAFYETPFTASEALKNYKLYCSENSFTVQDPGITFSESATGQDNTAYFTRSFGA
jgi:hypothetical protein